MRKPAALPSDPASQLEQLVERFLTGVRDLEWDALSLADLYEAYAMVAILAAGQLEDLKEHLARLIAERKVMH